MPKLTRSLPKYRRHKASGQAVVTLDGRDFYLGPHGTDTSKIEYDRLIGEWLAHGRRLPRGQSFTCTVGQLLDAYLKFAEAYYVRPNGTLSKELDAYRQASKPLRRLYGHCLTADFGAVSLKTVRQLLIDRTLTRTHINHQTNRIRRIFKWGVENELVPADVLISLWAVESLKRGRTAARETDPVHPVPDAHVDALKSRVCDQVWAMIQLQRLTGMRSGEVTQMRLCDINTLGSVWEYRPPNHKTAHLGHERIVYLGPRAQDIIRPFLKSNAEAFLFSPRDAMTARNLNRRAERRTPMTPSQRTRKPKARPKKQPGQRYTTESYGRAIKYAIKKANVPHWHPHQLRHNAATEFRRRYGLDVAQVLLGHHSADITQMYAELDRSKAINVVRRAG